MKLTTHQEARIIIEALFQSLEKKNPEMAKELREVDAELNEIAEDLKTRYVNRPQPDLSHATCHTKSTRCPSGGTLPKPRECTICQYYY